MPLPSGGENGSAHHSGNHGTDTALLGGQQQHAAGGGSQVQHQDSGLQVVGKHLVLPPGQAQGRCLCAQIALGRGGGVSDIRKRTPARLCGEPLRRHPPYMACDLDTCIDALTTTLLFV